MSHLNEKTSPVVSANNLSRRSFTVKDALGNDVTLEAQNAIQKYMYLDVFD